MVFFLVVHRIPVCIGVQPLESAMAWGMPMNGNAFTELAVSQWSGGSEAKP